MSRRELAEAVNTWLWETTLQRYELGAHTLARYERGAVRWSGAAYRSGLRHVLGAARDAELDFWSRASEPCADTAEAGAHQVRTGRRPGAAAQPRLHRGPPRVPVQEYQSPR